MAKMITRISMIHLIWLAGSIQAAVVISNFAIPGMLHVRQGMSPVPKFLRQVFYVHWFYIVFILAFFSALCFGFASELAGATPLGRFVSAVLAAFWLLRIALQWFYYDAETRRLHRALDILYSVSLVALVMIFGSAALKHYQ
jgi:hypothetical protein